MREPFTLSVLLGIKAVFPDKFRKLYILLQQIQGISLISKFLSISIDYFSYIEKRKNGKRIYQKRIEVKVSFFKIYMRIVCKY